MLNQSRAYSEPIPRSRRVFPREVDQFGSYLGSSRPEVDDRIDSIPRRHTSPISPYRSRKLLEAPYFDDDDDDTDSLLSLQELRSEINDARLESLDRSFEDPDHPTLGTRLDRSLRGY